MTYNYDLLIIGAGASGLMAAYELRSAGKRIAIIEARDRIGGRIHTISSPDFSTSIEAGAEFIHGDLPVTFELLQKAGVAFNPAEGDIWQKKNGLLELQDDFLEDYDLVIKKLKELHHDISIADFFQTCLPGNKHDELKQSLQNYVEGYYAGDISKASSLGLLEELSNSSEKQYRIDGGYVKLINFLEKSCRESAVNFYLSKPVTEILRNKHHCEIIAGNEIFTANKIIVTVPLGVLIEQFKFSPSLDPQLQAAQNLGYGPVIKIILEFSKPFWTDTTVSKGNDLQNFGFVFSKENVPTWWSQFPAKVPIITGWCAGPNAEKLKTHSEAEILEEAIKSLANIFDANAEEIRKFLTASFIHNWATDPYSLGAYSYEAVGGKEARKFLKEPVEDTIYFAGEALHEGIEIGTVEGALRNGREVAKRIEH